MDTYFVEVSFKIDEWRVAALKIKRLSFRRGLHLERVVASAVLEAVDDVEMVEEVQEGPANPCGQESTLRS